MLDDYRASGNGGGRNGGCIVPFMWIMASLGLWGTVLVKGALLIL